jgi:hypothetical protein
VEGVDVTTGVGVVEAGLVGVLVRAIEHDVPVVGGVPPRRGGGRDETVQLGRAGGRRCRGG